MLGTFRNTRHTDDQLFDLFSSMALISPGSCKVDSMSPYARSSLPTPASVAAPSSHKKGQYGPEFKFLGNTRYPWGML